ncbi:ATPase [Geomonas silvestris]|uniref:ATPase n=1 Tax=Geomonas silvestris TaxID=2740184 RepID=A0A6V8MNB9_9BACT|nr:cation-translocating P-type ATPase [Geomonas silvestris]GFO61545.1 ATPase [Geomonas silvestris]
MLKESPDSAPSPQWHTLGVDEVYRLLDSSAAGLTGAEAARRLAAHGPNLLSSSQRISPWRILLEQFKNVLIIILLLAAGLSIFLGHAVESAAIAVIVAFAALLGFFQEYRAERALEALREMAAPTARVLRDGEDREIPAAEVVPGDLVLLAAGDRIPADLRVCEAVNLRTEEASLTGESKAVEKTREPLAAPQLPLGDRRNLCFAGTAVSYGRGRGVVVATGMATEFGKIAGLLQTIATEKTPLQKGLDRVGVLLARAALVGVLIIFGLGLARGENWLGMLLFAVALGVAVVPEALPAVVTISLALGVQRLVRRHALMRRLPAVETLGCTSVICSDKTGTLTRDEMTVRCCLAAGTWYQVSGAGYHPAGEFSRDGSPVEPPEALRELLRVAVLASDARLIGPDAEGRCRIKGDPTEGALVVAAAKAGLEATLLAADFPRFDEIPFSSETKRMTTLCRAPQGTLACVKGAPEVLLDACSTVLSAAGERELDEVQREELKEAARQMAGDALRVLAIARRVGDLGREDAEHGLTLLGLVGMSDPPRPEAAEAIRTCRTAGIRPVLITGDHPGTARAVARELGLLRDTGRVVTGPELEALDDRELDLAVTEIDVYARVAPVHKLRVVAAWQRQGQVVAMTGDGVNDAPALKKADIGIAMGITGTAVSKEAAAMTLTDDNFASIVAAVAEGRAIYDNIRKYLMYLLSSNLGEIGLMAGALLLGLPLPLSAVQILYVNLATDGLPALALAVDPADPDLMRRPPRDPQRGIFTRAVVTLLLAGGGWSTLVNLLLFSWALASGKPDSEARTMTFVSLVLIEFFKAYHFRSDRGSVFQHPFANRWLNRAILWELVLLLCVVYIPVLQSALRTYPLSPRDWLIVAGCGLSILPVLELAKWFARRGSFGALS